MLRKILPALFVACLAVCVLSSCDSAKPDTYKGESNTNYEVGEDFTIDILPTPPATSTNKHLVCKVTLELTDSTLAAKFDAKKHRINEIIINAVRSRTREELAAPDATTVLGEEITAAINDEFNTEGVAKTYFSTFFIA